MASFTINVVSDIVCPWCYVGYKRLHNAMNLYKKTHPTASFSVSWHPFYLNPAAPSPGVDKRQHYISKFGLERTQMMWARLDAVGQELGIPFAHGGKTGNTRDGHRLLYLAGQKGGEVQNKVAERFFKAYLTEEKDISDKGVLATLAEEAGLEKGEVEEWLGSDKGGKEVDQEAWEARMKGVTGVPNFTINGKWVLGGAQEEEEFIRVFEEASS